MNYETNVDRLDVGDFFDKDGKAYYVVAVKNSIALAKRYHWATNTFGKALTYVSRGGFAGGA